MLSSAVLVRSTGLFYLYGSQLIGKPVSVTESSSSAAWMVPFASADVSATRHAVATLLNEHSLVCENGRLKASMEQCTVGAISIMRLKYGAPVRVEPRRRDGFYIAQVPTRGHARVHFANASFELGATIGALVFPMAPLAVELSDHCEQYILKVPIGTMHRIAQATLGLASYQLRTFEQPHMLGELEARSLIGLIEYVMQQRPYWGAPRSNEVFSRNAEELLAGCLLLSGYRERLKFLGREDWGTAPRYLRQAEDYMRANIQRPLLLGEIARSIGVGVRTLHNTFRDFRGTTPMATLQTLRLAAVRNDLLSAPNGTRVADVARRWGFRHHGRFSMAYRRKFGEHPSQTLRK